MPHSFYSSQEYQQKQSSLTRGNWEKGKFDFLYKRDYRKCAREECRREFFSTPSNPKKYCSQSCAATVNNSGRRWTETVKRRISKSLLGKENLYKGILKVPRTQVTCSNPICGKIFTHEKYRPRTFCSNVCAIDVIGRRPTSPKASRGKAGIRKDIDSTIYFYSRWEANIARLYTYLGTKWVYEPTSFDIGGQMYTPDFYLPETNVYIEVKNFWWEYSKTRDEKFRKSYPALQLEVILREDYLELEKQYAHLIPNWEYKNSKFEADL